MYYILIGLFLTISTIVNAQSFEKDDVYGEYNTLVVKNNKTFYYHRILFGCKIWYEGSYSKRGDTIEVSSWKFLNYSNKLNKEELLKYNLVLPDVSHLVIQDNKLLFLKRYEDAFSLMGIIPYKGSFDSIITDNDLEPVSSDLKNIFLVDSTHYNIIIIKDGAFTRFRTDYGGKLLKSKGKVRYKDSGIIFNETWNREPIVKISTSTSSFQDSFMVEWFWNKSEEAALTVVINDSTILPFPMVNYMIFKKSEIKNMILSFWGLSSATNVRISEEIFDSKADKITVHARYKKVGEETNIFKGEINNDSTFSINIEGENHKFFALKINSCMEKYVDYLMKE